MPTTQSKKALVIVIHNVRSAHNVGSIFRTADAVGVEKIYLCGYTPIPSAFGRATGQAPSGAAMKIAKTALGAEKTVPWEYCPHIGRLLKRLRHDEYHIVALEQTQRSRNLFSFKPKFPVALVVGNEIRGIPSLILKLCDTIIEIPMYGKKESLNVSVAAGIALYALGYDMLK